MSIVIEPTGQVKRDGRKIAQLRNDGALCDIRRHSNGFLYGRGGFRVSVAEDLLEALPDTTLLQFTHLDTKDMWTITVHDFRHYSDPVQYAGYECQRACEIIRMNHTLEGKPSKKRVNELYHIETTPIPEYKQPSLFG
jgi:hypothetical protein